MNKRSGKLEEHGTGHRLLFLVTLLVALSMLAACTGTPQSADQPVDESPAVRDESADEMAEEEPAPEEASLPELLTQIALQTYATPGEYETETGNQIAEYGEAPMLSERVASGELPPVEERLPDEPLVVAPEEQIGEYGGTMNVPAVGFRPDSDFLPVELTIPAPDMASTGPNLARDWEVSEDGRVITFHLREGLKWSDGEPLTADDFLFWWNDVLLNDELYPVKPSFYTHGGEIATLEKLDDYTIRYTFAAPNPTFAAHITRAAGDGNRGGRYLPEHYMSQFHPDYASTEEIESLVEAGGFGNWMDLFEQMANFNNPERPVTGAWIVQNWDDVPVQRWVRNPYYHMVDTDGNQLPYVDEIRVESLQDTEAAFLKIIAGDVDWFTWLLENIGGISNYPTLLGYQQDGDFHVVYKQWQLDSYCNLMFNFTQEDTAKAELYQDVRFRQALSLAMNRQEINDLLFEGVGIPTQVTISFGPPYHGEADRFKAFTEYNPEEANRLLDEIGLTERDADGYRLGLDGEDLTMITYTTINFPQECTEAMELAREHFTDVGIEMVVNPEQDSLWHERHDLGEHDLAARAAYYGGGGAPPEQNAYLWALTGWDYAPQWALWLDSEGESGVEPPEDVKRLRELHGQVLVETSEEERIEIINEALDIQIENLWTIGTLVIDPRISNSAMAHNRIGNIPPVVAGHFIHASIPASWYIKYDREE